MPRRREEHGGLKRKDALILGDHVTWREYNYEWPTDVVQTPYSNRLQGIDFMGNHVPMCNKSYIRSPFHYFSYGTSSGQFVGDTFKVRSIEFKFCIHAHKINNLGCGPGYNIPIRITIIREPTPKPLDWINYGPQAILPALFRVDQNHTGGTVWPARTGGGVFVSHVERRFEILYDETLSMPISGNSYSTGDVHTNFFCNEGTLNHDVKLDFPELLECRVVREDADNPYCVQDYPPEYPLGPSDDPLIPIYSRMSQNAVYAIVTPLVFGYYVDEMDHGEDMTASHIMPFWNFENNRSGVFQFYHMTSSKVSYVSF